MVAVSVSVTVGVTMDLCMTMSMAVTMSVTVCVTMAVVVMMMVRGVSGGGDGKVLGGSRREVGAEAVSISDVVVLHDATIGSGVGVGTLDNAVGILGLVLGGVGLVVAVVVAAVAVLTMMLFRSGVRVVVVNVGSMAGGGRGSEGEED